MHHIKQVHKILKSVLNDKLSDYLFSVLSNMLSIDFHARHIDEIKAIDTHSFECSYKILRYLGHSKLLSDKFEDALMLFATAISEDDNVNKKSYTELEKAMLEQQEDAAERLMQDLKQNSEFEKLRNDLSSFVSKNYHTNINTFKNRASEKQKTSSIIVKSK